MQARYYDPVIGRFLSNDPVGFAPSRPDYFNRYAYVGNDPLNKTDPDGQMANFVLKFAVDVALEITIQAATGQDIDIGSAVKESAKGILNPAKTAGKIAKLGGIAGKKYGSYTLKFKNGKNYHGKGDEKRMEKSIKEKAEKNGGLKEKDWEKSANERESFKDEHKRLTADGGGHKSDTNLNKIASPGKKMCAQDKDC